MRIRLLPLLCLLWSGCNVFASLDAIAEDDPATNNPPSQSCTTDCSCSGSCDVDCSGCVVECNDGTLCEGTVARDSRVVCQGDASCEVGCTAGECEYSCASRASICYVDCSDGAECLLNCGTQRNPAQLERCEFTSCAQPTDCGGGVFVCNRACP